MLFYLSTVSFMFSAYRGRKQLHSEIVRGEAAVMAFRTVCSKNFHLTVFRAALPPFYRVILADDALQL